MGALIARWGQERKNYFFGGSGEEGAGGGYGLSLPERRKNWADRELVTVTVRETLDCATCQVGLAGLVEDSRFHQ